MPYIVDSTKFQAEGAYLRWSIVAQRLGLFPNSTAVPQLPEVLQLRWTLNPELGFPTEPFIVWRRKWRDRQLKTINAEISPMAIFGNSDLVDLNGAYSCVALTLSGNVSGSVVAFVGAPLFSSIVAMAMVTSGDNVVVQLTAPSMEGLIISPGLTLNSIVGTKVDDLSDAAGWEQYERVGIPVKQSDWASFGSHGIDQGMFGAFIPAQAAAIDRLRRGAPPIGWSPTIDGTIPAPTWSPPAFPPLITELNQTVLSDLQQIAALPPTAHAGATISKPIPPLQNSSGQSESIAQILPLNMLYIGAGSDCFAALALGFGTAYPVGSSRDYDFMVTVRYRKGLSGKGEPVEYAAIVPAPPQAYGTVAPAPVPAAYAPPVPANLAEEMMGHLRPLERDRPWRGSVRVSWDKPVPIPLFRARSFAFVRAGISPAAPASLIMNQRASGGALPISVNYFTSPEDLEPNRLSAVDREIPIPPAPGSRTMKYAVAHQDIYGQWSGWSTIDSTIVQPPADKVRIVSAELKELKFTNIPTPPNATCFGKLVIEFLWDWRLRSPLKISFRGRLYAASYPGQPPPNTTLPNALETALSGLFTKTFTLNFNVLDGATTSDWAGYDCKALDPSGEQEVTFGNAQGQEVRRYRVTIPGFQLNFASTGHIGLALWAQGQEAIPDKRTGAWSDQPSLIAISDPRPPLITPNIVPDIVPLASLPDAAGECHAVLKWSASPGAAGYFIYETTETKLRRAFGDPEPDPNQTLSERLTRLQDIFDGDPAARRSEFVRRNSQLIKDTSADVTLPRGSTAIHLFVVLGVSAGQVESAWITSSTALYAFAAPRVPKPGAPMIEVVPFLDKAANLYRAKIKITTRKGPVVSRIDLHRVRVDDAAKELDTMGPPVMTLDALNPGWLPSPKTEPEPHIVAKVEETPSGSWKRVWYRAVAWSDKDESRGTLGARSPASTAVWVVIPPSTAPNIMPLILEWAGGALGDVLVRWTSTAPLKKTPLGSHKISINAKRVGAPPNETPLIAVENELNQLGTTQPITGSGAWRIAGTKPIEYRAIVRRANVTDAVQLSVRITDPLGRTSEALATIQSGPILPAPVLSGFVLKNSVTPAGRLLEWVSPTPLNMGSYTLQVQVRRPPLQGQPISLSPITIEMALADVPLDEPGPIPSGNDPLRVRRMPPMPGVGSQFSYYAFVRVPFTQIIVRLTSPDGRVAQHIQLPN